jgi:hypothetical protein
MFRLVWVFYGTNVILWALSGYRWVKGGKPEAKSSKAKPGKAAKSHKPKAKKAKPKGR